MPFFVEIILWTILLFIGAIAVYLIIFGIKFYIEILKLSPMDTQEIIKDIFVVRDTYANMFFVKTGENYIAIDAGKSPKNIAKGMKELGIDIDKVIAVFITHSDYDHIAAVKIFKKAKVYFPRKEIQMIDGSTRRLSVKKNKFKYNFEPLDEDVVVKIENAKIKGIHVPGHTYGLMCYVVNDKFLFTGDALSLKNGQVEIYSSFFNKDTKMLRNSLKELAKYPGIEYMFTAHYKYSDNFNFAFKEWK